MSRSQSTGAWKRANCSLESFYDTPGTEEHPPGSETPSEHQKAVDDYVAAVIGLFRICPALPCWHALVVPQQDVEPSRDTSVALLPSANTAHAPTNVGIHPAQVWHQQVHMA